MKYIDPDIFLSPTDLSNYLSCKHLTGLEMSAAKGERKRPNRNDAGIEALAERGRKHEEAYKLQLELTRKEVVEINQHDPAAYDQTIAAMKRGAPVIFQAALRSGRWRGFADFLIRVDKPSRFGLWSYEVTDTKLAQQTKAGTVLQLCMYSEIVAAIQGVVPEKMCVVKPAAYHDPEIFKVADYFHYYCRVKAALEKETVAADPDALLAVYPDPVSHCDVCRWWTHCNGRRRDDDHLRFVAGLSRRHQAELETQGISKLEVLAGHKADFEKPRRGTAAKYQELQKQAALQLQVRQTKVLKYELLDLPEYHLDPNDEPEPEKKGFLLLPEPNPGDMFFDLEGLRFTDDGPMEYLFGWYAEENDKWDYTAIWIKNRKEERAAYRHFMQYLMARWEKHPGMHVYHFAPYEISAIKRLMMQTGEFKIELDDLLRGEIFVDLYRINRQAVRAGVERYGLKQLEDYHGYKREMNLEDLSPAKQMLESRLEMGMWADVEKEDKDAVELYNKDDCISTLYLRNWLEKLRLECAAEFNVELLRPVPKVESNDKKNEEQQKLLDLETELRQSIPEEPETQEDKAQLLLSNLIWYFRIEENVVWWEFFRMTALEPDEIEHERKAVANLEFVSEHPPTGRKKNNLVIYRYPAQEMDIKEGKEVKIAGTGKKYGTVEVVDRNNRLIHIRVAKKLSDFRPDHLFNMEIIRGLSLKESIIHFARSVLQNGIDGNGPFRAARDLLLRRRPRGIPEGNLLISGENTVTEIIRNVNLLSEGVLAVQGPPGSGKTYTGVAAIIALINAGKRVGITAVSHKVIRNLLDKVVKKLPDQTFLKVRKGKRKDNEPVNLEFRDTEVAEAELDQYSLIGATAFFWSREANREQLDYLFVDEAGQMSLAVVLAAATSAKNIVLLGDPQQLEQPQKGSHPGGAGIAALDYLIGGHKTIDADKGILLPQTWRMHPDIAGFISALYYDGKLEAHPELKHQQITGSDLFPSKGLHYVPVAHENNSSRSDEEAAVVKEIISHLTSGLKWVEFKDDVTEEKELTLADIRIVTPYNAQVSALKEVLPEGTQVGTVDKFQGQEGAVVIFSMASSSAEDAPRGMSFLYSTNRFNVAVSRARCLAILVASEALFNPECKSPEQIRLANQLCSFLFRVERNPTLTE